jgi:hypothetical protein
MPTTSSSMALISKVAILKIPPQAWDAIIPHGPKVSQRMVEYFAAGVIRDIATLVPDKATKQRLMRTGRDLATTVSSGLVQGWEDGDDICPPWPPGSGSWWGETLKPQPLPWKVKTIEQFVLADLIASVAEVTTNETISAQLKETAFVLVRTASNQVMKDFEQTPIKPRSAIAK